MAHHKSAKKRIRQTLRRREVNKQVQSRLRTLEKNLRKAIEEKKKEQALEGLKIFTRAMDRSAHSINNKNRISRKKSRLTLLVQQTFKA